MNPPCPHCNGTGVQQCRCPSFHCKRVEGHPLNRYAFGDAYPHRLVKQCKRCGRVWIDEWEVNDTGRMIDCGVIDPASVIEVPV